MAFLIKNSYPTVVKGDSSLKDDIKILKKLRDQLNDEGKQIIDKDIKLLEYGFFGEEQIMFELKNSHFTMCILRDLYISHNDQSAQIDFLVVTKKICFIIESKNLYGNIEINERGDFIRNISFNNKYYKEGIYSPITQNIRHLELIKKIRMDKKKFIERLLTGNLDNTYKSVIVLANPKTVLNDRYAKKEIKEQVIRLDGLIAHIKKVYNESKLSPTSQKDMEEWANLLLEMHSEKPCTFTKKYVKFISSDELRSIEKPNVEKPLENTVRTKEVKKVSIREVLKKYRVIASNKLNSKPYMIFTDAQLNELVDKLPKTREDLLNISGFGEIKVEKYGADIIALIKKYA